MNEKRILTAEPFVEKSDDHLIICRCEEVTKGEIRRAIYDGMLTLTEIRRYVRAGMGLCQGQTCGNLVKRILAEELEKTYSEIETAVARAPMRPIEMYIIANEKRRV